MAQPETPLYFDIWGCRGSRSLVPPTSAVGNRTSCYSLSRGDTVCVVDAGRGLPALGAAMRVQARFQNVKTVHVLVSHAHMDHWEGIKDVDWFWRAKNGLEVTLHGTEEALGAIERAFAPPSFVPLNILSINTVAKFGTSTLKEAQTYELNGFTVRTFPLHHYSGSGDFKRFLDTIGFVISTADGARVAYLSDHEPVAQTLATEREMASQADLVVYDSHFRNIADHAYGHGSQEHTANMAKAHPQVQFVAGHHGPTYPDERILEGFAHYGQGLSNFLLAKEGDSYRWDASSRLFTLAEPNVMPPG
jgi:phosphoribosyl 1,2-cyclic phosphodiesterase